MGEAYICERGSAAVGRAVDGYAIICASYPVGSSCTCFLGNTSLSIENGGGTSAFAVNVGGTWTIAISDGTHTASGCVTVIAGGMEKITLSYDQIPAVSSGGVLLSSANGLASGYTVNGNAAMNGNSLRETGQGGFWLTPAVDLTGYSTLTVTGYLRSHGSYPSRIGVGSTSGKVYDFLQTPDASADWGYVVDQLDSVTINVAGLTGSYYIGSTSLGNTLELTGITLT